MTDRRVLSPTAYPSDLAVEAFLSTKTAERCTAWTLRNYRRALARFVTWLSGQGITEARHIMPAHVRSYLAHLTDLGLKASSVHDYARPVKTWLRFLYAENIIPDNPTARVKLPRIADDILPAFAADDVRKLLEACQDSQDSERDTALVLCLLDTGYRAAEFVALTVGDVDPKAGAVTVRSGKGNKGRTVYIGARARRALARYLLRRTLSANDPLFPLLNIDCF